MLGRQLYCRPRDMRQKYGWQCNCHHNMITGCHHNKWRVCRSKALTLTLSQRERGPMLRLPEALPQLDHGLDQPVRSVTDDVAGR